MRVYIFYFSFRHGKDRQRIQLDDKTHGYVRVEVVDIGGPDALEQALDRAAPMPDEMVMNTHALPPTLTSRVVS